MLFRKFFLKPFFIPFHCDAKRLLCIHADKGVLIIYGIQIICRLLKYSLYHLLYLFPQERHYRIILRIRSVRHLTSKNRSVSSMGIRPQRVFLYFLIFLSLLFRNYFIFWLFPPAHPCAMLISFSWRFRHKKEPLRVARAPCVKGFQDNRECDYRDNWVCRLTELTATPFFAIL